jgi:hypothetical protein
MANPPIRIWSYDTVSGDCNTVLPFRGKSFGSGTNGTGGIVSGTLDLGDSKVVAHDPIDATIPGKTLLVAEINGKAAETYWVTTRSRKIEDQTLSIQGAPQSWQYFGHRLQATDYSTPPDSPLAPGGMTYWTNQSWDAALIGAQLFKDVINNRWATGGTIPWSTSIMGVPAVLINGMAPQASSPVVPSSNYVAPTFPLSSAQYLDPMIQQLVGYGYLTGFDFNFDVQFTDGPGSPLLAVLNIWYPRSGSSAAETEIVLNTKYMRAGDDFTEDSTQQGTTVVETGVQGAMYFYDNIAPVTQGWPIIDKVASHSGVTGPNILPLLESSATSDSYVSSFPVIAPVIPMPLFGPGSVNPTTITKGDDCYLRADPCPVFPQGWEAPGVEWRIANWNVTAPDDGDATVAWTLNLPPAAVATGPAL